MEIINNNMAKMTTYFLRYIIIFFLLSSSLHASPWPEGIQVYQKNLHLVPEHKQKLAEDINRYRNADNLWDVLREEFSLSHFENNYAVQAKIEWYMNTVLFALHLVHLIQYIRSR